jgi:hypothetical protein
VLGNDTRLLKSLPTKLKYQSLLRIHRHGLSRRDTKEDGIEAVDSLEEPSSQSAGLQGGHTIHVPAIAGHVCGGACSFLQEPPEGFWTASARETARDADDRDRRVSTQQLGIPFT